MVESVCQQGQNALQRLLACMLDEPCCSIGPVEPHSLLLFGPEILTCEIAVARASTKQKSSGSSDLQLSDDGGGFKTSLGEPISIPFPSDFNLGVPLWFFKFDFRGRVLGVRSVQNNIHGCPETRPICVSIDYEQIQRSAIIQS